VIVLVRNIRWIGVTIGTSLAGAGHAVCTLWDMLLTTPPPSGASGYSEGIPGAAANCVRVCLLHPTNRVSFRNPLVRCNLAHVESFSCVTESKVIPVGAFCC
jgi:hypothetical protein